MTTIQPVITQSPQPPPSNALGLQLNLEGVGILLGILVSLALLGGLVVQFIIDSRIKGEIEKLIDEHAKTPGHRQLERDINSLQRRVVRIEAELRMEPMTFSKGDDD